MSYINKYYPRRPIRSFQDLQVYQKTLGLAVTIVKKTKKQTGKNALNIMEIDKNITENLTKTVMAIPRLITTAHSLRFGNPVKAINRLEKTMLNCNLAIYYLELFRDIVNPACQKNKKQSKKQIDAQYFEKQIKEYLRVRGQILRLQKSWIKFMPTEPKSGKQ